jgi:hypothetical protein
MKKTKAAPPVTIEDPRFGKSRPAPKPTTKKGKGK